MAITQRWIVIASMGMDFSTLGFTVQIFMKNGNSNCGGTNIDWSSSFANRAFPKKANVHNVFLTIFNLHSYFILVHPEFGDFDIRKNQSAWFSETFDTQLI